MARSIFVKATNDSRGILLWRWGGRIYLQADFGQSGKPVMSENLSTLPSLFRSKACQIVLKQDSPGEWAGIKSYPRWSNPAAWVFFPVKGRYVLDLVTVSLGDLREAIKALR